MSIAGRFQWPDLGPMRSIGDLQVSSMIDATNKKVAVLLQFPRTGTITHVGIATGTVTVAADIEVRLETNTVGAPSGTLHAANATGTQASPAANTYYLIPINGGAGVTVTGGDQVWVVFACPSGSPNLGIKAIYGDVARQPILCKASQFNGAAWVYWCEGVSSVQFVYSDAPVWPFMGTVPLGQSFTARNFNSNTTGTVTGDECGMRLTLPFACRSWGATMIGVFTQPGSAILYAGTTALRTFSWPAGTFTNTAYRAITVRWPTPVDLAAGEYILALRPDSTSNLTMYEVTPRTADWKTIFGYPAADGIVTRVDGGAWSAVDTSRMTPMALEIQQITTTNSGISGRRRPLIIGA